MRGDRGVVTFNMGTIRCVNARSSRSPALPWAVAAAAALMAVVATWAFERIRDVYPVDWAVYRYGSSAAWHGVNLYAGNLHGPNIADDGLPFTYTPFGALVLWPTNLGSQQVGFWAWSIVSMLALLAVIAMVTPSDLRHRWVVVFGIASVACATIMVYAHFFFGQINILLMLLVIADLTRRDDTVFGRRVPRGVLIGLAAAVKLTPGLFIVYLAVARQWRMFWWSVASCVGAFVVAFLVKPSLTIAFLTDGLWHLTDKVALGTKFATSGNNSIQGVLAAVGDWTRPLALVLSAVAAIVGLLLARRAATHSGLLAGGLVIAMTATLISPISWVHHWVYLVPIGVFIWFHRGWGARAVVFGGILVTVFATPEVGQDWLVDASVIEAIIGWLLREMLMLLGILAIAIIAYGKEKPAPLPSGKISAEVDEPVRA